MPTRLTLSLVASLLFAATAWAQDLQPPKHVNAMLCETEAQAIAFASTMAAGETEPMALDRVNKAAGAQVCGRYLGYAVVEVEKTTNYHGGLFMLAGLRFAEDGKLGWTASWVTPFNGAKLERGA